MIQECSGYDKNGTLILHYRGRVGDRIKLGEMDRYLFEKKVVAWQSRTVEENQEPVCAVDE